MTRSLTTHLDVLDARGVAEPPPGFITDREDHEVHRDMAAQGWTLDATKAFTSPSRGVRMFFSRERPSED